MATTYEEFALVWTYHNANPGDFNMSSQELLDWDVALDARWGAKLDAPMIAAGLTLDRATKSQVVALAEVSPSGNDPTRVKNACKFLASIPPTS